MILIQSITIKVLNPGLYQKSIGAQRRLGGHGANKRLGGLPRHRSPSKGNQLAGGTCKGNVRSKGGRLHRFGKLEANLTDLIRTVSGKIPRQDKRQHGIHGLGFHRSKGPVQV